MLWGGESCTFSMMSVLQQLNLERENSNSNCLLYIGHRPLYKQRGWGVGGMESSKVNEDINGVGGGGGGGAFAHTENYQFWYNCSVIHSYTYYQEIVFFCLWHEK